MTQANIKEILKASADLKLQIAKDNAFIDLVTQAANKIKQVIAHGGTIYSCGNGGSACDSMHLTEELVARYKKDRPGIRAMHFMDPGILSCWSNDYSFEDAYQRQASTFCTSKDLLIAISTSGNSRNILKACKAAKELGTYCIALTGKGGGELAKLADLSLVVPSQSVERIQEVHITLIHIFCEMIEFT